MALVWKEESSAYWTHIVTHDDSQNAQLEWCLLGLSNNITAIVVTTPAVLAFHSSQLAQNN